jgi:predicted ArsR family transcriptional regulator
MENERKLTPQQLRQELRDLEHNGIIEKKRDALGNIVTRPGKDGKPRVVYVLTKHNQRNPG